MGGRRGVAARDVRSRPLGPGSALAGGRGAYRCTGALAGPGHERCHARA